MLEKSFSIMEDARSSVKQESPFERTILPVTIIDFKVIAFAIVFATDWIISRIYIPSVPIALLNCGTH